jgi:hypothetical protein
VQRNRFDVPGLGTECLLGIRLEPAGYIVEIADVRFWPLWVW